MTTMQPYQIPDATTAVATALAEDLGVATARLLSPGGPEILDNDVTSTATIGADAAFAGVVVARKACTVCGLAIAEQAFETLSRAAGLFEPVEFFPLVAEGSRVVPGTPVAEVEGLARAVLAAERTALDFLMILSGIATETARWVDLAGPDLAVCDTRKTLPGLRALSKYAVRVGGGTNHRFGLDDMVLVKDNHLASIGSIRAAVGRARLRFPALLIEVEADTIDQAVEAVETGADFVLLDNMGDATLSSAVKACREAQAKTGRSVLLEVSGNVSSERLAFLKTVGVDRVSSSALTFARPVDFGLDER